MFREVPQKTDKIIGGYWQGLLPKVDFYFWQAYSFFKLAW
jgi:hypothetical protein